MWFECFNKRSQNMCVVTRKWCTYVLYSVVYNIGWTRSCRDESEELRSEKHGMQIQITEIQITENRRRVLPGLVADDLRPPGWPIRLLSAWSNFASSIRFFLNLMQNRTTMIYLWCKYFYLWLETTDEARFLWSWILWRWWIELNQQSLSERIVAILFSALPARSLLHWTSLKPNYFPTRIKKWWRRTGFNM